jgi:hypothetical protein
MFLCDLNQESTFMDDDQDIETWHHLRNETLLEQLEWSSEGLKAVVSHARLFALDFGLHAVSVEHLLHGLIAKAPESQWSKALVAQSLTLGRLHDYAKEQAKKCTVTEWTGDWLHPDLSLDGGEDYEFLTGDSSERFTPDHLFRILSLSSQTTALFAQLGLEKISR